MRTLHTIVEILETRISPAVFFVSPISLAVTDSAGASAMDTITESQAAAKLNADFAISLATGDKLVYDTNANLKFDSGDIILASIKTGSAMAVLDNNNGGNDGRFTIDEFTGLAVSDGFSGSLRSANASVVTALLPNGSLAIDGSNDLLIQDASIIGLTVVGRLGNVGAGGSITNVKITPGPGSSPDDPGAGTIATGTAADGSSYLGRSAAPFTPASGAAGGSISKVFAARGVDNIKAGNGGAGPTGGAGGSISDITLGAMPFGADIFAGDGGTSSAGVGGAGGTVARVKVTGPTAAGILEIFGGDGGAGSSGNAGGAGGAVSQITATAGQIEDGIATFGGDGGNGAGSGAGGIGGAVTDVKVQIAVSGDTVGIGGGNGGNGGAGAVGGAGGAGGAIGKVTFTSTAFLVREITFSGGQGGKSGGFTTGGSGGAISDVKVKVANAQNDVNLFAGTGGNAINSGGIGGTGGALARVSVTSTGTLAGLLEIEAGAGGGASAAGTGGVGGALSVVKVKTAGLGHLGIFGGRGGDADVSGNGGAGGTLADVSARIGVAIDGQNFDISGGRGGSANGAGNMGDGGNGGRTDRATLTVAGGIADTVEIFSGPGGFARGHGGDGGGMADVKLTIGAGAFAGSANFSVGSGGNSPTGTGGAGGDLERASLINLGGAENLDITGGKGGDTTSGGTGSGGPGGVTRQVLITNLGETNQITASSGTGGDTFGSGGGGQAGNLESATIKNAGSVVFGGKIELGSGYGGDAAAGGSPGDGGDLLKASIIDPEGIARLEFFSGSGGEGKNASGGHGGVIDGVKFTTPHGSVNVEAGNGGNSQIAGGNGGIVRNISGKAGTLFLASGFGGDGTSASGDGGDGGLLEKVNVAVTYFARAIIAGGGGDGSNTAGGTGGDGGAIKSVKITGHGDIGNFANPFGGNNDEMGGLLAGLGGKGATPGLAGSIDGVTAKRIAAIYAGTLFTSAGALTAANAVTSIAHITANVIGADQDGDGLFDFIDAGAAGFGLGQGDTAIDGLVIVKAGGFDDPTINATPLFKIEA